MAREWCVKFGILPHDEAARLYDSIRARKARGTPSKKDNKRAAASEKKSTASRKKRAVIEDDLEASGGVDAAAAEGVGTTGL
eukprot:scaffold7092_cov262-Pinguiococcus_pyrenoidosus.AAC.8